MRIIGRWPFAEHVVLVCGAINLIDVSGVEMLNRLNDSLDQRGTKLHLAEVKSSVEAQLKRSKLFEELSGRMFSTTAQALMALEREATAVVNCQRERNQRTPRPHPRRTINHSECALLLRVSCDIPCFANLAIFFSWNKSQ